MIEGLGSHYLVGGVLEVRRLVDYAHRIARTDPLARRPAAVGRLDHSAAPGGQDHVALSHQFLARLQRKLPNVDDEVLRPVVLLQGRPDLIRSHLVGGLGPRMGCHDDGISGLDGCDGLDEGRGLRVGHRDEGAYDAHGFGDLDYPPLTVVFHDTHRSLSLHIAKGSLYLRHELSILVRWGTHAAVLDAEFRQLICEIGLHAGPRNARGKIVHLFLCGELDLLLGYLCPLYQSCNVSCSFLGVCHLDSSSLEIILIS